MKYRKLVVALILVSASLLAVADVSAKENPPTGFTEVAQYIKVHHSLPKNFITKKDAKKIGWQPGRKDLDKVAPGKSIGGDVFSNREKKLPAKKGRIWYEGDINYHGGKRGKDRILFSNDGLIYKSEDHYKTFTRIDL
jgi:uncharacterized protein YycO